MNLSLYYSLRIIPSGVFRPLGSLEMLVLDNNFLSTLSLSGVDGLGNLQVPQVFVACTYQILIGNQYFMFVLCCLGETGTILMYARLILANLLLFLSFKE